MVNFIAREVLIHSSFQVLFDAAVQVAESYDATGLILMDLPLSL